MSDELVAYAETDELVAYAEMGAGSVLTFLHPIGLNGSWFMPELELMSPTARALAPDLPGHGRSASYDGNLSIQSIGETVVALWDHLGIHRAAIVGISLGGMVAQTIATSHPYASELVDACEHDKRLRHQRASGHR